VSGSTTTPAGFANRHGVTLKQLRWFNPAMKTTKKGRLVAGQSLRIPSALAIDFAREIPDPGIERYGGSSPTTLTSRGIHVVKRGESLGVTRLKSLNGIKGSRVIAGQTLRVRSGSSVATKATAKKATAKKATAKKATAKKATAKKATAKKKTASSKKKTPPRR
jgi:membrane-bound lytic murein transglycosylase D